MKAMILAAGLGKRMRPLTDHTPKPLLKIKGKALIEYHIESLVAAGVNELVINHAYLGEQIEQYLGCGRRYAAQITYSAEDKPLETGGGIVKALPLLGDAPFIVINSDIWTDYPIERLLLIKPKLAHLVMVANPEHNPDGDMALTAKGQLQREGEGVRCTFSGISVLTPGLFEGEYPSAFPLLSPLLAAMEAGRVSGERYAGQWVDVGTPERLQRLND